MNEMVTITQAAEMLNLHRNTIKRRLHAGLLPQAFTSAYAGSNARYLFRRSDIIGLMLKATLPVGKVALSPNPLDEIRKRCLSLSTTYGRQAIMDELALLGASGLDKLNPKDYVKFRARLLTMPLRMHRSGVIANA